VDPGSLRDVLLVEAFEELDHEGTLLAHEERRRASRRARAVLGAAQPSWEPPGNGAPAAATPAARSEVEERFLVERARLLREGLARDLPGSSRLLSLTAAPAPPAWLVFGVTALLGLGADRLEMSQRLNLLSFSLLALLAWNLVAYPLRVAVSVACRIGLPRPAGLERVGVWLALQRPWATWRHRAGGLSAAIHGRFLESWGRVAAPLVGARMRCLLDLGAAGLALGLLGGIYLRGLVFEYRAGWESTFLDAEQVHVLLSVLLAPGAWLLGRGVPEPALLDAMGGPDAGVPAAEWIHLFAATTLALAIVPRLGLAAWSAHRARLLGASLCLERDAFPSLARALATDRGRGVRVDLESYSYGLSDEAEAGLRAMLAEVFGGRAELGELERVPYGGDTGGRRSGSRVIVFNAGQCPEREVHGVHLAEALAAAAPGERLLVVVDESVLRLRCGGGGAERLAERRRVWEEVLGERGIEALYCELSERGGSDVFAAARAAMWPAPVAEASG
jgi:hypothetical protein